MYPYGIGAVLGHLSPSPTPMRLGVVLRKYRAIAELSIRVLALDIGVSAATLSRIERGEAMDGRTLGKVLIWLMQE